MTVSDTHHGPRRYEFQTLADKQGITLAELGRRLNISGSVFKQYRDQGITELVADRRAKQCGLVAYEVWPEMLDHAIEDEAAERRRKKRDEMRRYRAKNPARRELERERHARYMAETREYQNRMKRRHYAENADRLRAKRMERYYAQKQAS